MGVSIPFCCRDRYDQIAQVAGPLFSVHCDLDSNYIAELADFTTAVTLRLVTVRIGAGASSVCAILLSAARLSDGGSKQTKDHFLLALKSFSFSSLVRLS